MEAWSKLGSRNPGRVATATKEKKTHQALTRVAFSWKSFQPRYSAGSEVLSDALRRLYRVWWRPDEQLARVLERAWSRVAVPAQNAGLVEIALVVPSVPFAESDGVAWP